jgi:hypothetical protein
VGGGGGKGPQRIRRGHTKGFTNAMTQSLRIPTTTTNAIATISNNFFFFIFGAPTSSKTSAPLSSGLPRAAPPHHLQKCLSVCAIRWQSLAQFAGRAWCLTPIRPKTISQAQEAVAELGLR